VDPEIDSRVQGFAADITIGHQTHAELGATLEVVFDPDVEPHGAPVAEVDGLAIRDGDAFGQVVEPTVDVIEWPASLVCGVHVRRVGIGESGCSDEDDVAVVGSGRSGIAQDELPGLVGLHPPLLVESEAEWCAQ
jgi:hypothetical protein